MVEGMKEQAAQSARQAHSMAALAYESKRDSEVMKAITVVTLIFLPATFVSVRPISCSGIDRLSTDPFSDNLQHGFLQF